MNRPTSKNMNKTCFVTQKKEFSLFYFFVAKLLAVFVLSFDAKLIF